MACIIKAVLAFLISAVLLLTPGRGTAEILSYECEVFKPADGEADADTNMVRNFVIDTDTETVNGKHATFNGDAVIDDNTPNVFIINLLTGDYSQFKTRQGIRIYVGKGSCTSPQQQAPH